MTDRRSQSVVYADGSCLGNPGPGGWGVVIVKSDGSVYELSGFEQSTTNNRMEITAAIEALRAAPAGTELTLRSDSQYLVKTMTLGWRRRENLDLWRELDTEAGRHKVNWQWVRGHAGDPLNDRADELARSAALRQQSNDVSDSPAGASDDKIRDSPPAQPRPRSEAEVLQSLRPLLREGETIRRCASCGRAFVVPAQAVDVLAYCSLAPCQLNARETTAARNK